MATEQTLVILKPDALERGVEYELLERFRRRGFQIQQLYLTRATEEKAREHYELVIQEKLAAGKKGIAESIVKYMTSGPILVALIEGNHAVKVVREMSGAKTQPIDCASGTIRGDYGVDSYDAADAEKRAVYNLIHSSDSAESAKREIEVWFGKSSPSLAQRALTPFDKIASEIGELSGIVRDIVNTSNKQEILYHGIKDACSVEGIQIEGLKPLSPHDGGVSCWSTGLAVFYPINEDSVFFSYSGRRGGNGLLVPDTCELAIAMTDVGSLRAHAVSVPEYVPDSQMFLKELVPPAAISILDVIVKHPVAEDARQLRKYRREAEMLMLRAIDIQVCEGLSAGEIRKYKKSLTG